MNSLNILGLATTGMVAFVGSCLLLRKHLGRVVHMLVGKVIIVAKDEVEAIIISAPPLPIQPIEPAAPPPVKHFCVCPPLDKSSSLVKWIITNELDAVLDHHVLQSEAIKGARALAITNCCTLVIIGKNGEVRRRISYAK